MVLQAIVFRENGVNLIRSNSTNYSNILEDYTLK